MATISLIPYQFYTNENLEEIRGLFTTEIKQEDSSMQGHIQQVISSLSSCTLCKGGNSEVMEKVVNKIFCVDDNQTWDDKSHFHILLKLKVANNENNFDDKSIVNIKKGTINSDLEKEETTGDGFFLGLSFEKNYRTIKVKSKEEKRHHGLMFVTHKGNENVKGIGKDIVKKIFKTQNIQFYDIADQTNVYNLDQHLKSIEISGYIPVGAISQLDGMEEKKGGIKAKILIEDADPKFLAGMLGRGKDKKLSKKELFNFDVKNVKGIIRNSNGGEDKIDLENSDGTIESIRKALSIKMFIEEKGFNIMNIRSQINGFISMFAEKGL
ncbi:hypothetical protein K9M48_04300 [Candidatus Gracilibacteria bacterium]|nr:hypothetical protein [Candidatus Gracilibacteria bacterium]